MHMLHYGGISFIMHQCASLCVTVRHCASLRRTVHCCALRQHGGALQAPPLTSESNSHHCTVQAANWGVPLPAAMGLSGDVAWDFGNRKWTQRVRWAETSLCAHVLVV